jgi:hypothetical protein
MDWEDRACAVAQMVYNDTEVENFFTDRIWGLVTG